MKFSHTRRARSIRTTTLLTMRGRCSWPSSARTKLLWKPNGRSLSNRASFRPKTRSRQRTYRPAIHRRRSTMPSRRFVSARMIPSPTRSFETKASGSIRFRAMRKRRRPSTSRLQSTPNLLSALRCWRPRSLLRVEMRVPAKRSDVTSPFPRGQRSRSPNSRVANRPTVRPCVKSTTV
jgi:hypothetical protein